MIDWGWQVGDEALVTTQSGITYAAVYTLAPGIDYFWAPLKGQPRPNALRDPDVSARAIEKVGRPA